MTRETIRTENDFDQVYGTQGGSPAEYKHWTVAEFYEMLRMVYPFDYTPEQAKRVAEETVEFLAENY